MFKYRPADSYKGIYCLEGNWYGLKDKTTVEPAMSLLERNYYLKVPYLHHDVATRNELEFRLKEWARPTFNTHPILYLGFHGNAATICVGDNKEICLDEICTILKDSCKNRVIHLGSCSTLALDDERIRYFRNQTGALALFGYEHDIDWLHSIAFEVLLLGELQYVSFTFSGMKGLDARLNKTAASLRESLKFSMHYGAK